MQNHLSYDVIIVGGSYAGLSAAMALGRSKRRVLVIDGGQPCNRQTPHAHNLINHDGEPPAEIAHRARAQVLAYPSVTVLDDCVITAAGTSGSFTVNTETNGAFNGKKLILTTGVRDIPQPIKGFEACWGISVLHCPYCHGYEVRDKPLGVIGNGDMGFEFARLISNWSAQLTLFTNAPSTLSKEQAQKLASHGITVNEKEIAEIRHQDGYLRHLQFSDGDIQPLKAIFARSILALHGHLAQDIGCEIHSDSMFTGLIKVDDFGKTTVPGIYAAGDCCTPMRSLANAISGGVKTGAVVNHELIAEEF